jgi:DNA-binding XRE family transcriptional regulator
MRLFRNRLSNILQQKTNGRNGRNLTAFRALMEIGFSPAQARRGLIAACGINVRRLAETADVTAPTIYAACYGKRNNMGGKAALSRALEIPVEDLFPELPHG